MNNTTNINNIENNLKQAIIEIKLLELIDATDDGILSLETLRKNNIPYTSKICDALKNLIDTNVLVMRDCMNFAVERPDNARSRYGEQPYFNQYIHLRKADYISSLENWNDTILGCKEVMVLCVLNDIGCCINCKTVDNEKVGIEYFNSNYDNNYSYEFITV